MDRLPGAGRDRRRQEHRSWLERPRPAPGRRILAWLILLLALLPLPAYAQTFPKVAGYVVDDANILTPDVVQQLDAKLRTLDEQTHRQFVVATIKDLQGYPIEDYGYKFGRAAGIGQKETNSGALLIVAPNERKVRIEAGYGLEPVLTDALSSQIINTQIVPRFKAGDMAGGVVAGAQAVIDLLALPDAEAKAQADAAAATQQKAKQHDGSGAGMIFWLFFLGIIFLSIVGRRRRGIRTSRFGGGAGNILLWTALNALTSGRDNNGGGSGGWGGGFGGGGGGGGFSGGGGSFGGGGASGSW